MENVVGGRKKEQGESKNDDLVPPSNHVQPVSIKSSQE